MVHKKINHQKDQTAPVVGGSMYRSRGWVVPEVYIYGPLNYNPVERYFFDRVTRGRPVCVPYGGKYITQLGDLLGAARGKRFETQRRDVVYFQMF